MCNCRKTAAKRETYVVTLPGGLKTEKTSKAAASAFVARHPGATMALKTA